MSNIPVFVLCFLLCRARKRTEVIIGPCFLNTTKLRHCNTSSVLLSVHRLTSSSSRGEQTMSLYVVQKSLDPVNVAARPATSCDPGECVVSTCCALCVSQRASLIISWTPASRRTRMSGHEFWIFLREEKPRQGAAGSKWSPLSLQAERWTMGNPDAALVSVITPSSA